MSVLLHAVPELKEWIADLDRAEDNAYVRPPGLCGPFRAKHFRAAQRSGAVVLHYSGRGFCWATDVAPGAKGDTYRLKPSVYQFDRDVAMDDNGPPVTGERIRTLLAQYRRMHFGLAPKVAEIPL